VSEINIIAVNAKNDEDLMNQLILQYENFILKCASAAARKYISKSDDECWIAMAAFKEAVRNYSTDKGSFFNFSELIIRRRIVDYVRSKSRYAPEFGMTMFEFETEEEDDLQSEISNKIVAGEDNSLRMEIYLINEIFSDYNFSFMDLIDCSPKTRKAKKACAKAVSYMIGNAILISEMKVKKQLPMNLIKKNAKISSKLLERYQKYIIAAVEIITGEYPYLAGYMSNIREESKK
jgi:RNA polymerase sigma factor